MYVVIIATSPAIIPLPHLLHSANWTGISYQPRHHPTPPPTAFCQLDRNASYLTSTHNTNATNNLSTKYHCGTLPYIIVNAAANYFYHSYHIRRHIL